MPNEEAPHVALWTDRYISQLNALIPSLSAEAAYRVGICQCIYYQKTGDFPPISVLSKAALCTSPLDAVEFGRSTAQQELNRRDRRRRRAQKKGAA